MIASAGGIPVILQSMKVCQDDGHVQELATGSLWTLTNAPSNLKILREENAKDILLFAREHYPKQCGEYVTDLLRRCRYAS